MSKLKNEEIDLIVNTYKEIKSIRKTAEITGFSVNTVNKYVMDISKHDIRSRNCKNEILQINLRDNSILREWSKPSAASKELKISSAEICRVLKGELKQAGGFGWIKKVSKN